MTTKICSTINDALKSQLMHPEDLERLECEMSRAMLSIMNGTGLHDLRVRVTLDDCSDDVYKGDPLPMWSFGFVRGKGYCEDVLWSKDVAEIHIPVTPRLRTGYDLRPGTRGTISIAASRQGAVVNDTQNDNLVLALLTFQILTRQLEDLVALLHYDLEPLLKIPLAEQCIGTWRPS